MMQYWSMGPVGWPMMFEMIVWNLCGIAILLVGIWVSVRWLNRAKLEKAHPLSPPEEPSAMETLYQRYARGEIDTATFTQTREHLEEALEDKREHEPIEGY